MSVFSQITGLIELQDIADKLESFPYDVKIFAQNVLSRQEWKKVLLDFNDINLDSGLRPDGTEIEKTPVAKQQSTKYERYTIYLKNKRGLEIGEDSPVTLNDTGEFRANTDIKVLSDGIYFINRDWKGEIIQEVWGQVLGITEDQLFQFTDMILPVFEDWLIKRFKSK